jgi:hypothetical protein
LGDDVRAGRLKLTAAQLEWARAKYAERRATLSPGDIARELGVSHTTLLLSLFPDRRRHTKARRVLGAAVSERVRP